MSKIAVVTFECDACGHIEQVPYDEKRDVRKPSGFTGWVTAAWEGGETDTKDWYACSKECVTDAVLVVTGQMETSESA